MNDRTLLKNTRLRSTLTGLLICLLPTSISWANNDSCFAGAEPLLSVADFSGDGQVDNRDLTRLGKVLQSNRYVAFYDRNADGHLDTRDLDLANQDLGKASSLMDQDIASVFWGTTRYQNLGRAALDGYEPTTQVVAGHGRHWMLADLVTAAIYPNPPILNNPAGLNYDEAGTLQAVFWSQPTAYPFGNLPSPQFFSTQQMWHGHNQACVTNYGLIKKVNYKENIEPLECRNADGISGTFYMLHLWLYRLNPNGAFAMTHPCA